MQNVSTDMQYLQYSFTAGMDASPWFSGWTVPAMREAIEQHDAGYFWLSSAAEIHATRLAPVMCALIQRIGPPLGIERAVHGSKRWNGKGLGETIRSEVEDIFSETQAFSIGFLGSLFRSVAMMGVAIIHHPWKPSPDGSVLVPELSVWPMSSANWDGNKKRYVAHTVSDGHVDVIDGDGHWTVVAPWGEEGHPSHLMGAIRAIGMLYMKGGLSDRDEAEYSAIHGLAKFIGYLPPGIMPKSEDPTEKAAALDFMATVRGLQRPRAGAVFQNEAKVDMLEPKAATHAIFEQIARRVASYVAMTLIGQDASIGKGTGVVYTSPMFEGVKFALTRAETRGAGVALSRGVARPYAALNYAREDLAPRLEWLLPDLEQDARTTAYGRRMTLFLGNRQVAQQQGFNVDQEESDDMAQRHGVVAPELSTVAPTQVLPSA